MVHNQSQVFQVVYDDTNVEKYWSKDWSFNMRALVHTLRQKYISGGYIAGVLVST